MCPLTIGKLKAMPGETVSGPVRVPGTGLALPVTIIRGEKAGPAALISAGIHPSEYVGIAALQELAEELSPADLRGDLILIRLMNPTGFERRARSAVPEDGKNLNRVFPGSPAGTASERIAHAVSSEFFPRAAFYVDLHSGDACESLVPMIFSAGKCEPRVASASREMAEAADARYLVVSQWPSGQAYGHAAASGIPAILLERGQLGLWSREEAELCKADVRRILARIGLYRGAAPPPRRHRPRRLRQVGQLECPATGLWYPERTAGDRVRSGRPAGEIRDLYGKLLAVPKFAFDGVILYQNESLSAVEGESLVTYGGDPE
ncbi:MAG: succinylglutamate desuccinylase/aspartoacylase family protein [Deltaproteobacteria bacterium]|jgi:predicted deacylase|nr:succinylglutamate desuccinylase/aspartoacylase family protein [Deltaproteobacteria bacterium]